MITFQAYRSCELHAFSPVWAQGLTALPLPIILHLATQCPIWSVTQHAARPKPNGAIIKNDRNLFLAMKQAEATDMSS